MRSEAGSLWSLAAGLVSDFPLSKQRTLSEFLLRKKKARETEDVRFLLLCVSTHRFSQCSANGGCSSIGLLFCWRKTTQVREMQQAKQASWERATSGLRASERRGRSQGAHGYWLDGLGRCVCGCVSWLCGWWVWCAETPPSASERPVSPVFPPGKERDWQR